MANGLTIMLIPDNRYREARPKVKDHHLTLGYFGKVDDVPAKDVAALRRWVEINYADGYHAPISAKANGLGIFDAGSDGFAVVDLIDGFGINEIRADIEKRFGPKRVGYALDPLRLDLTHGFTPHMTREYLTREDDFYAYTHADQIDGVEFEFTAIGVWAGDHRYEVSFR